MTGPPYHKGSAVKDSITPEWRQSNIRAAQSKIAGTPAPEGVKQERWRNIQGLLIALAEFLPDPYPTQMTLAKRMRVDLRSVKRRVAWAVEAGVLRVSLMPSPQGWRPHNRYEITLPDGIFLNPLIRGTSVRHRGTDCPLVQGTDCPPEERTTFGSSLALTPPLRGSVREKKRKASVAVPAPGVDPTHKSPRKGSSMSDWDPEFSQGVSDDSGGVEPVQRKLIRRRSPVGEVTQHFRDKWEQVLNGPGGEYLRMAVLFDSVAAFQTRIKVDCLGREGHSVAEVCASIDQFIEQVLVRRVIPKPGQPVWKLWWSRRAQYQRVVSSEEDREWGQQVQAQVQARLRASRLRREAQEQLDKAEARS